SICNREGDTALKTPTTCEHVGLLRCSAESRKGSSAGFPTCCIAVLPACEPCDCSCAPRVFDALPIGNRRYSRLGNLRYGAGGMCNNLRRLRQVGLLECRADSRNQAITAEHI